MQLIMSLEYWSKLRMNSSSDATICQAPYRKTNFADGHTQLLAEED